MTVENRFRELLMKFSEDERQRIKWGIDYDKLKNILNYQKFNIIIYPKPSRSITINRNEDSINITFVHLKLDERKVIKIKDCSEMEYSEELKNDIVVKIARSIIYKDALKWDNIILVLGDSVYNYERSEELSGFLSDEDFIADHRMVGLMKSGKTTSKDKNTLLIKF